MKSTKSAFLIAIILAWVSLWVSIHDVPVSDSDIDQYLASPTVFDPPVQARGGWPFAVFNYPVAPLGNDIPPDGSIFPFALNVTVFFIIAWAVLNIMPTRWKTLKLERSLVLAAFAINSLGLLQTIIMFD